MTRGSHRRPVLSGLLFAATWTGGFANAQEGPSYSGVMQYMQEQMHRISDGLMMADMEVVADAARAISERPRASEAERVRIVAALGPEIEVFERIDLVVRNTAKRLEQSAGRNDRAEALHTYFRLMDSCLACHRDYQDRVDQALSAAR